MIEPRPRAGDLSSLAREWDVVVVGAGPAGSAAAHRAASRGAATLLIDRAAFPRTKVCGGCLSPSGVRALRELGVAGAVVHAGVPIRELEVAARNRWASMALAPGGVAIARHVLDPILVDAARAAGATVLERTAARLVYADERRAGVALTSGDSALEITAASVIAADGLAGTFLPRGGAWEPRIAAWSRVGIGAIIEADGAGDGRLPGPGVVRMFCGRSGYVGMVRLADGSLDVAAAVAPAFMRRCGGPGAAVKWIMREADADSPDFGDGARWHGTPKLTRRRIAEAGAVFAAGDAVGYVEPFTGEGMSCALESGMGAADHALAWVAESAGPGAWGRRWGGTFQSRRRRNGALAIGLRSPRLVSGAAAILGFLPVLVPLVRGVFAGPWGAAAPGGGTA